MIRWELRVRTGDGPERTVHMADATWEGAAARWVDMHQDSRVVAWRQCQCPAVYVLGDARRIIG